MMNDTIVAIATPPGVGAIGIIRLSGPQALAIATALFRFSNAKVSSLRPRFVHYGKLHDNQGQFLDEALVVFMPGPHSFTGEDVVELHCHGGGMVLGAVLEACVAQGARLAEAGEFSKRAFMTGRMDLTQAEAIMELINAPSKVAMGLAGTKLAGHLAQRIMDLRSMLEEVRVQLCVAVDFPEDEVECLPDDQLSQRLLEIQETMAGLMANHERAKYWRDGALVVLAGQVNAGKSSLMNAILGIERAIVTEIPGTTRDYLEESIIIDGLPVRLVDTAGLRASFDAVEQMGIERSRDFMRRADLVLLLIDADLGPGAEDEDLALECDHLLVVANKMDLVQEDPLWLQQEAWVGRTVEKISAKYGQGVSSLLATMSTIITQGVHPESHALAPNLRQQDALGRALSELKLMHKELSQKTPYDVLAVHLDMACAILGEITGEITSEAVLQAVFNDFCIGK